MQKVSWYSKTTIFLLSLLALFLSYQKFSQYQLQKSVEKEKLFLQKQISDLEKTNTDLEQTLNFLDSDSYKEIVARQQLNMQKAGEQTYNFTKTSGEASEADNQNTVTQSNFNKWLSFFLNKSK
jgi:cell division protein FtsB